MEHFIIFDMDGVLVNTEPLQYELWKETFAQRGLEIDYDHYKGCIGSNPKRLMQLIWEGYGVDFREDTDIRPRYEALKAAYLQEHPAPAIEGAAETVRALKGKVTMILTTHYMEEAQALCDRIGIMKSGRLLAVGTADELIAMAGTDDFESAFVSIVKEGKA